MRSPERCVVPSHVRYYAYRNQDRLAYRHGSFTTRPLVVADAVWTLAKAGIRSVVSPDHRHDAYYHVRTVTVLDVFRRRWGPYPAAMPRAAVAAKALSSE